jgi:ketosteroid isomerase-like protein
VRADDIAATGSPALASIELLEHVAAAYNRKDWRALRALYHDEARLCTSAAGDRVVGPDELMDVFEELEDSSYAVGTTTTRALDEHAVLVSGRLRYPRPGGGMGDGHRSWILTFKDGLVWRSCFYRSDDDARAAYEKHGIDLDIGT